MAYLYETHVHTSQGSSCASSKGSEYVPRYQDLGYTGIIITDHFFRGTTAIDRSLPWEKWVNDFCRGYEDAKEEGARRGLDVFFGWEERFGSDDFLVYGLDKEWLLQHPEVPNWTWKEQYDEVRRYGGCIIHAHPFRQRFYIKTINLITDFIDGVEAANAGSKDKTNDALALVYAKKLGLPVIAGSDSHNISEVGEDISMGVYLDKKMDSISDFVDAVLNNSLGPMKIPAGHCDFQGNEKIILPVNIIDENDQITGRDVWEFLGIKGA